MIANLTKNTKIQEDSIQVINQSLQLKTILKIYKIKICDLRPFEKTKQTERAIYLSITFNNSKRQVFQTKCIDILRENAHFQVKTLSEIQRIEVIDYDTTKRLCKFSLKGIKKDFNYKHVEPKSYFSVTIQMNDFKIGYQLNNVKLSQSKAIDNQMQESKQSVITNSTQASIF